MAIVKTTIGIPDNIYNLAEDITKKLGVSRSHFYAKAVEAHVKKHLDQEMARMLDEAFSEELTQDEIDLQLAFKKRFDSILESENETW
ncbi:MAG: hypothetical protein PHP87_10925 [Syntrophomonas sp.]|uniref:hypothetical protein n=1 Tax=Syntrophomonas sp. TaxID=2053627 RepID=UPI00261A02E1|nr:hypothetical protein [Syntrophomonas sp.]MDD4627571.1 hypothetical protein [Syntrophomonas sp.]